VDAEYKATEINIVLAPGEEIIRDDDFKYDGYQVVRGEFFAHLREPSITFNRNRVSLNTACLKRFPNVDYVQILVHPDELKLAVLPCNEDKKDSFSWCSQGKMRRPKQVTCRVFFAMVMDLMNWNTDYRYKLLGKLVQSRGEYLFIFDLTSPEVYQRTISDDGKQKTSRTPVFPAEWQNQFGLPVEEHRKRLQVDIFKGYTVFSVNDKQKNNSTETQPKENHHEQQTGDNN